jgi:hypothetical protein
MQIRDILKKSISRKAFDPSESRARMGAMAGLYNAYLHWMALSTDPIPPPVENALNRQRKQSR